VRSLRLQDGETRVGGPLEEGPKVVAIGIERAPALPGKKCCRCRLRLIEPGVLDDGGQSLRI
jgi:hypothetical protein